MILDVLFYALDVLFYDVRRFIAWKIAIIPNYYYFNLALSHSVNVSQFIYSKGNKVIYMKLFTWIPMNTNNNFVWRCSMIEYSMHSCFQDNL